MVAFNDKAAAIWRQVAAIEQRIAEEAEWQRERMAQLKHQRDQLLLKLVDSQGARHRDFVGAR